MGESEALERAPFFHGKVLTPEDLERTQEYFREKFKRHNRSLHGFGIVSGLRVTVKSGQIVIEPGLALDCEGNELHIERAQSIIVPPDSDWQAAFVNIRFNQACAGRTAIAAAAKSSDSIGYSAADTFEVTVAPENSNRGHRHLRARWLACGQPHALTIAKLKYNSQVWRVERGYRAPHIK
jgi:hypothetical protein